MNITSRYIVGCSFQTRLTFRSSTCVSKLLEEIQKTSEIVGLERCQRAGENQSIQFT